MVLHKRQQRSQEKARKVKEIERKVYETITAAEKLSVKVEEYEKKIAN